MCVANPPRCATISAAAPIDEGTRMLSGVRARAGSGGGNTARGDGRRQHAGTRLAVTAGLVAVLLTACAGSGRPSRPTASSLAPDPPAARLGELRNVDIVMGVRTVPGRLAVYAFRDHVAADPSIRPLAPNTHWSSADLQVCSAEPVELAFFAWVVADDVGRS